MGQTDLRYLKSLSNQYPTIATAATEIINLQAILSLPKATEHFITDVHGEYDQFLHVLKNGSGAIKRKIEDEFGNAISAAEKKAIATLIYYPEQKLEQVLKTEDNLEDWYKVTLYRLIRICKNASSKYTRSKVRKALPKDFAYVIEELLTGRQEISDQEAYYNEIIRSVIRTGRAAELVIAFCNLIRRLVVDHLHIVGDVFDRGPGAAAIMDRLMSYHSVDIQWGNHDVQWMGAAAGSLACIANVLAISTKYSNFDCLEDGYGINMRPLTVFALETYADDPCECFIPRNPNMVYISQHDENFWAKVHKAISVIQFKLEGQIIKRHPEFNMDNHLMLDKINYENGTIMLEGKEYKLKDTNFPTINPENPFELTDAEKELMNLLRSSFLRSEKLQNHVKFLYEKGSIYLTFNNNLLYHGCIPMNSDGTFTEVTLFGETVSGKSLMDKAEQLARDGYFAKNGSEEKEYGKDFLWFLWCGCYSPVYGKNKMTSFERYFIDDESTWVEIKDEYYHLIEKPSVCNKILCEFGIDPNNFSHIINGHVPVKIKKGESPIKSNGKLLVIDGGLSKAYQKVTGLAGYTLLFNSHGLLLSAHDAFESIESAIKEEKDIHSTLDVVELAPNRLLVEDTDAGKSLSKKITDLKALVDAYLKGKIKTH